MSNTADTVTPRVYAPPIGARVLFIESGKVHAADVVFVNDDGTLNLRVLAHDGSASFARTNVQRSPLEAGEMPAPAELALLSADERARCEQRWYLSSASSVTAS